MPIPNPNPFFAPFAFGTDPSPQLPPPATNARTAPASSTRDQASAGHAALPRSRPPHSHTQNTRPPTPAAKCLGRSENDNFEAVCAAVVHIIEVHNSQCGR